MKKICTLILLLTALYSTAQVNGYAKVTGIVGPILTVTASNETYDEFNIGDKVIIMQMQDNVIGSNTGNNSSFGNLDNIGNAGKFEVATVLLVARTGILPTIITLSAPLKNAYNTGSNSSVQVITFPTLGTGNYTTTSAINALPWNGNIGGVVAFSVNGILTLEHNISANAAGFRGGANDASTNPYGSCNATDFFSPVHPFYGNKGEGIYKVTNANFAAGKGKMLNGGGGGNTINSGGGGGGNYTAGGDGYWGWSCSLGTGGIAGVSLMSIISSERFFMGGGGGSGEANDNANNKGGNGGGIVIIKANVIRTTGTGSVSISANGQSANHIGNDGAGGGGAGGSVYMAVNNWNIAATKPLTISSDGGVGGNVEHPDAHGGGGGGAQGTVIYSTAAPTTNVTTTTSNGIGGLIRTGTTTRAASGQGASNIGIIADAGASSLPLKLIAFTATKVNDYTKLEWKTQNEVNVSHFQIERSANGTSFVVIGNEQAVGMSNSTQTYSFADPKAVTATAYYRLRMVDVDGKFTYSQVLVVRAGNSTGDGLNVFPNPATTTAAVFIKSGITGTATIRVLSMHGATVFVQNNLVSKGENSIMLNRVKELSSGVYNVQVSLDGENHFTRLVIQK